MNRFLTFLFASGLFAGPVFGQSTATPAKAATARYEFRFVADKDIFYVPWNGNGEELERLLDSISRHQKAILNGEIPVLVDGYCNSQATPSENLAMAKIRSNRVKTEMIRRGGLTEACFTTKNHTAGGNIVTVRMVIPAGPSEAELEARRQAEAEKRAEEQRKAEEARRAAEQAEAGRLEAERQAAEAGRLEAERQAAEAGRLAAGQQTRQAAEPVAEEPKVDRRAAGMPAFRAACPSA